MKHLGPITATAAAMFMVWFMYDNYPKDHGSTAEYRARLDEIIAQENPLSVADIGIDAELFMENVHE